MTELEKIKSFGGISKSAEKFWASDTKNKLDKSSKVEKINKYIKSNLISTSPNEDTGDSDTIVDVIPKPKEIDPNAIGEYLLIQSFYNKTQDTEQMWDQINNDPDIEFSRQFIRTKMICVKMKQSKVSEVKKWDTILTVADNNIKRI